MSGGPIELFIKASPDGQGRGDCPFSQKANMALRLAGYSVQEIPIDLKNKPESFLKLTKAGSAPVMRCGDLVLTDSEDIVQWVAAQQEQQAQSSTIKSSEKASQVGGSLFPAAKNWFMNKDEGKEAELRAEFEKACAEVEQYLEANQTPFLDGEGPSAADCALLPKLYHAVTILGHQKQYQIPEHMKLLRGYVERGFKCQPFEDTTYPTEYMIQHWSEKRDQQ